MPTYMVRLMRLFGRVFLPLLLLFAGTLPSAFGQCTPDVNADGAVTANDALILYYAYALRTDLGSGRGGTATGSTLPGLSVETRADDSPEVSIAAGASPAVEGSSGRFVLTASEAAPATFTVEVELESTGAFGVTDGMRPVEFVAGSSTASLIIELPDDTVDEADGTVTATIQCGEGYRVGTSDTAELVLADDDVTISIAAASSRVVEGGAAAFVLTAGETAQVPFTVNVELASTGTSLVMAGPQSAVFDAGADTATLSVDIQDDDRMEHGRVRATTAEIQGSRYTLIATSTALVRTLDNDGAPFRECDSCPEMAAVSPGTFTKGAHSSEVGSDKSERPAHEVTIAYPFAVGRYEVTFDEWEACRTAGGCTKNPGDNSWGRGTRPVIYMKWSEVREYLDWVSQETGATYRLLTESEWEYAARGGTQTPYHWGDNLDNGSAHCAGCGASLPTDRTAPVGSYAANQFGLYDMLGNVWEWVEDCAHSEGYDGVAEDPPGSEPVIAPTDGSAWTSASANTTGLDCTRHVARGGAYSSTTAADMRSARSFAVSDAFPAFPFNGFRVARTLP